MALRKSNIAGYLLILVTLAFGISCNNEDYAEHIGSALLHPQVSIDASAVAVDGSVSTNLVNPVPSVQQMGLKVTNMSTGREAQWKSVLDYPMDNSYLPGKYFVETAYGDSITEGFECPYFYASAVVDLSNGAEVDVPLVAKLASSMVQVEFSESFRSYFSSFSAVLHSEGGRYVEYFPQESRPAYLHPGNISIQLYLTMPSSGEKVMFEAARLPEALPGYAYVATVDLSRQGGVPAVIVSFDNKVQTDDAFTILSEEFLNGSAPVIHCTGFTSGTPLEWIEGNSASTQYSMSVESDNLASLTLTTRSTLLCSEGWLPGVDILRLTEAQTGVMHNLGLEILRNDDVITIDFSGVLKNLRYEAGAMSTLFTLEAVGKNMRLNAPVSFEVVPLPVDLKVVSASDIVAGVNKGEIIVESPTSQLNDNLQMLAFIGNKWVEMPVYEIESRSPGLYALRFDAPDGTEAVRTKIMYCGMQKAELILKRVSPKYTIAVDAYALKAVVKVIPEDENLTSVITSMLRVYGNGSALQVIDVDAEHGILVIGGLSSSTDYSINATVMQSPSAIDFCPAVNVHTENVAGFANGSFEDREKDFEYKDMNSGGRYSQNIVPIFNQQNRRSFEIYVPEKWATTNPKTACLDARNINTWYVEPSAQIVEDAYAGAYAVMLQSVGWDVNGEAIPDYLQPDGNYTKYSCNVPNIAHRAAGRLFLGDYSFNPYNENERYDFGIDFGSRPSALNGFYKFVPSVSDPSDRGVALVEVLGIYNNMEIVIARTELQLRPALTYTAFTVPLSYPHFGVKATRLRVMMASSSRYGSIAEESVRVPVSNNVEIAAALGSTLWVDELSLSY